MPKRKYITQTLTHEQWLLPNGRHMYDKRFNKELGRYEICVIDTWDGKEYNHHVVSLMVNKGHEKHLAMSAHIAIEAYCVNKDD